MRLEGLVAMLMPFTLFSSFGLVSGSGALTGARNLFVFGPLSFDVRVSGDDDSGTSVLRAFFLGSMVCRRRVCFKVKMAVSGGICRRDS